MTLVIKILLMLLFSSSAWGATYYIDYSGGSNSNPGTKAQPWKSHPYMNPVMECNGGTSPTYRHSAGDRFIFKGGERWPSACFTLIISESAGTSGNPDYYGVDWSWYSGESWSRPIFDGEYASLTRAYGSRSVVKVYGQSYVTFDNFEMKGLYIWKQESNPDPTGAGLIVGDTATNITVQNCYLHGWVTDKNFANDGISGGVIQFAGSAWTVKDTTISNTEFATIRNCGMALYSIATVERVTVFDTTTACLGCTNVKDSTFYNISYPVHSYDGAFHSNGIYSIGNGTISGNLIYNFDANAAPIAPSLGSGGSGPCQDWTQYVYNNIIIMKNSSMSIAIDAGSERSEGDTGYCGTVYILNNTIQSDKKIIAVRIGEWTFGGGKKSWVKNATIQNNHIINSDGSDTICASSSCSSHAAPPQSLTKDHNLFQSNATANGQGYVAANDYAPGPSGATIDTGVDKSVIFSTDKVGVPRPQGSAWDMGAYEYRVGSLKPPTALRIVE